MSVNVGTVDRVFRAVLGVVLLLLAFTGVASGFWAWVAGLVGIVMLVVAATRMCPIYAIFGIKTCKAS
ncbi:DUF2892 domain-containing protein [Aliishimia ponticola]|uniref:DUF2892 domain-containing protein n=1 Tax=Aliishimia ponticola TaxID=2499833 RepID=A0A4S4NDM0_9RHOB|nr:DUF2892 domain-containing protein [Aliishimia ponticola]THH36845.1 DUF2892 domain-containing protein [Aliishimia ponticola]